MPVSVGYISKEAGTNLWRNRLMTIAAVLTVAVSLALVGSVLLLKQGASNATTQWQQGVDVAVFVNPQAATAQYNAIGSELKQLPFVKSCTPRSQPYDLAEAKRLEPPDLSNTLSVSNVPSSWRCHLTVASQSSIIIHQFSGKPGVFAVSSPTAQIRTMENVIHVLQWVFLSVAVVLLLSASVLILNTIRMAIFARRREVSVMKLVGATNWFIRLPFMAEGLVQGLVGGGVAVLAVLGLYWGLGLNVPHNANGSITAQMAMGGWEVVSTCILVMVVGVGVGVIGSAFAVRRFLDV